MLYFNGKPYFVPFIESSSTGGIIYVDELPTWNINENAFYCVNGRYYKYNVSNTWTFKDILDIPEPMYYRSCDFKFYVNKSGVTQTFEGILFGDYKKFGYYNDTDDVWSDYVYAENTADPSYYWLSAEYKTIVIQEMPTDETFLAWFNDNAIQQEEGWVEYDPASSDDSELPRYDGKPIGGRFIDEDHENAVVRAEVDTPIVVESYLDMRVPLNEFGNARPDNVFKGVTFTSSAGVKVEGTYVPALVDNDIRGTWVFYDVLSIPNDFYGKEYTFRYLVYDIPNVGDEEFTSLRFYDDGIKYMEYLAAEDNWAAVYQEGEGFTGWFSDSQAYKTIVITESPTDETFIDWLKVNATKTGTIVEDVILVNKLPTKNIRQNTLYRMNDNYYKRNETNVLVFNDALSVPEKMYSKTYHLSFSVNVPNGPVLTFTEIAFGSMGEVSFYGADGNGIDSAYADGWKDEKYKTININEMPTDEVLLEWLRANAMPEGSWDEYAETTSITPIKSETWVFNEELTSLDKPFTNGFEDVACSGYMLYDYGNEPFNFHFSTIRFCFDSNHSMLESIRLINSETDGISIYYIDAFVYSFRHRTITFTELPDDEVFLAWLKANATKTSGGSSDTGAITEIQTPEELDEILANATSSDVGKAYVFVGESNGKYKNNSIYIIREV